MTPSPRASNFPSRALQRHVQGGHVLPHKTAGSAAAVHCLPHDADVHHVLHGRVLSRPVQVPVLSAGGDHHGSGYSRARLPALLPI